MDNTQPGTQPPAQPGTVPASPPAQQPGAPATQQPAPQPGTVPPGQQPGQPAKPADQTQPGGKQQAKVYTSRQLNAMKEQWRAEVLTELEKAQQADAEGKARQQAAQEGKFEQAYNDEARAHAALKEENKAVKARLGQIEAWLHTQLDERVQQLPEGIQGRDPKARDEKVSVLERIEWLDDVQATLAALGTPVGAQGQGQGAGQRNGQQPVGAGITSGDQAQLGQFSLYGTHPGNPQAPQGGGNSRVPTPEERAEQRNKERRKHSFNW